MNDPYEFLYTYKLCLTILHDIGAISYEIQNFQAAIENNSPDYSYGLVQLIGILKHYE